MHSKRVQLGLSAFASFLTALSVAAGLPPIGSPPNPTATPIVRPTPPSAPNVNPPILGPSATVVLPTAAYAISRSVNGLFQRVGIPPDQVVQVTVQYPSTQSAEFVKVEAVDGGLVAVNIPSVPNQIAGIRVNFGPFGRGVIAANGTFTFAFKAGHTPGLYQLRLKPNGLQYTQTDQVLALRFWVVDSQNVKNNPPVITPTMTGGRQ
jgi:hypothetical protein